MAFSFLVSGRRDAPHRAAKAAHAAVISATLSPRLYLELGVPDTFTARAQVVTLAAALIFDRLARENTPKAKKLVHVINQKVLDGFDAAFREQGVGDASIARKVRKLAETHSGFGKALMHALSEQDVCRRQTALEDVLARNGLVAAASAPVLATVVIETQSSFSSQPAVEVMAGQFDWCVLTGASRL